jgi:hypothetical protein
VDETDEPMAVTERKASTESERRTYVVAAVLSNLGIVSVAAAVYYRFAWQMYVPFSLHPAWQFPCCFSSKFQLL